jgi:potassium-dependent mechanosensitive channel
MFIKTFLRHAGSMLFLFFAMATAGHAQGIADSSTLPRSTVHRVKSPADWLQETESTMLMIESRIIGGQDTSFMNEEFDRLEKDYLLAKNDFDVQGQFMRIRNLEDLVAKLNQQKAKVITWRNRIYKVNGEMTGLFFQLEKIKSDSIQDWMKSDTALWSIYGDEIRNMEGWVEKVDNQYYFALKKYVQIEHRLNALTYNIIDLTRAAEAELKKRGNDFFHKTHPAVWQLTDSSYKQNIGTVILNTFHQSIDSLAFYGKNAYVRAILFRLFILLITMLPVFYFRRQKKEESTDSHDNKYKLLHKYTGAASASFGLVMAPFIFINAPHIFIETILVTLAITTSVIFLKENPGINRTSFYILLAAYIILHVFNLMTSVTLFGRILWSFSILLVIPLLQFLRDIRKSDYQRKLLITIIIAITIMLLLVGWAFSIGGYYPFGRILVMSSLDGFFLFIILFVAVFSFLDFIVILCEMYNRRGTGSMIRSEVVYKKLRPIVTVLAIAFWFAVFLRNVNAFRFIVNRISGFISEPAVFGGYSFNYGSILVFVFILFIALRLSAMLSDLFFDDQRGEESTRKSRLGSYLVLLRLFIISAGFILAMLAAGIPLSNASLIIGAFGVGIGFGLQHIISNLVSGVIIAFEKPIYVGDIVEIEGIKGKVTDIGLRATRIDSTDGAEYIVPNGDLISKVMKNWTLSSKNFKIEMNIAIGLDNDIDEVTEILTRVLEKTTNVLKYPIPKVILKDLRPNALEFLVSCWVADIAAANNVRNELLTAMHKSLKEGGIEYPRQMKQD